MSLSQNSLFKNLRCILKHLPQRRRQQLLLMLALGLATAFSEVLSLGALLPFLGALANPQVLMQNPKIQTIAQILSITSPHQLSIWLSLGFILAVVTANTLRLITLWFQSRLIAAIANDLSVACYRSNLLQPYSFYLTHNSSKLIVGSTEYIEGTIGVIYATLNFVFYFLMLTAILFGLLLVDWQITLGGIALLGTLIVPIVRLTRYRLARNSNKIVEYSHKRIKLIQESMGGIRDILLDGSQPIFLSNYQNTDLTLRQLHAANQFMGSLNRPYMEAIAMTSIAILALLMLQTEANFLRILPVLGTLVLGLNRLLPSLQQCYSCWAWVRSNDASLKETLATLEKPVVKHYLQPRPEPLPLNKNLRLQNVWFRYSPELNWVLRDVNLTISVNSTIGFFGGSGCGKSTTADLILGLIQPQKGYIFIDSTPLDSDNQQWAWQQNVANVPQTIYLSDTSIAENIAFGVQPSEIDMERVKKAALLAQIDSFIENLPHQYAELVGERGIRLSGGQRQRIGIARALYKRASVIVFDEATSALDNETEQEVMEAIYSLKERVTIIIIAHRLSTLRHCSQVFEFKEGQIVSQGTGESLQEKVT
ncbi:MULTISPECIES: ABC transporter ATP-binding protein [Calothrix]|uniref:ABC transporter ATP-binding protein n=2 Tax=Calothrix TaxID=1186 RepID=A0ABR8AL82_9CYAN|nr:MULTISPECIES: ABC transporter ATP-binding protein [Calothrix]MBD2200792.1 ABC transporter ATP-binding protein [Calothrix parietina FACHB-288]MBD2229825.1 ABC transporter ATP-binding protein [Calothrix anomala FACHB-343]